MNLEKYHKIITDLYLANKNTPHEKGDDLFKTLSISSSYNQLSIDDKALVWSYIFKNTEDNNIGHFAIKYFKRLKSKNNVKMYEYWELLRTWISRLDNWGHSDMVCSIYSAMLEETPDLIYPQLKIWAESNNPWKKRVAIVSLIYYSRCRKKVLPYHKIISLVEPQLSIDHYYLQKGVGWTLRELGNVYPNETWEFLKNNVTRITPIAFTAAIEKLDEDRKNELKLTRKIYRKNHEKN